MSSTYDASSIYFEDDSVFKHGLSDPSLLANQKRTKIFDLLNRLHNTGVSADIDLPLIAVIGSQSVGKSSLIEAMSGIALPRESGTCTRCPTECRLSSSEGRWYAQVSIRLVVDRHGDPLQRPTLQPFGDRITSKSDVEERIKRAHWMALMRNQKEKFKHGWYCVKQPGTAELRESITWEQARQNEREFFHRTPPWSTVEFDLKERLGTEKLSAALGQRLFDLILKWYRQCMVLGRPIC